MLLPGSWKITRSELLFHEITDNNATELSGVRSTTAQIYGWSYIHGNRLFTRFIYSIYYAIHPLISWASVQQFTDTIPVPQLVMFFDSHISFPQSTSFSFYSYVFQSSISLDFHSPLRYFVLPSFLLCPVYLIHQTCIPLQAVFARTQMQHWWNCNSNLSICNGYLSWYQWWTQTCKCCCQSTSLPMQQSVAK